MQKSDIICPRCGAGFRRLAVQTLPGQTGEYHCPACNELLETFDGREFVALRMTIQPSIKAVLDEATIQR